MFCKIIKILNLKKTTIFPFQEAFLDWERNEDPEEQEGKVSHLINLIILQSYNLASYQTYLIRAWLSRAAHSSSTGSRQQNPRRRRRNRG